MWGSWEYEMFFLQGMLKSMFILGMGMYRLGMSVFNWYRERQRRTDVLSRGNHAVPITPALSADPLVLRKASVTPQGMSSYTKPTPPSASRVLTMNLVAQTGMPIGVGWLYLYAEQKTARRVVKFEQIDIARAVCGPKKTRYYLEDVPYSPEQGIKGVQDEFVADIKCLLSRKASSVVPNAQSLRSSASVEMRRHGDQKPVKVATAIVSPVLDQPSVHAPTATQPAKPEFDESADAKAAPALESLRAAVPDSSRISPPNQFDDAHHAKRQSPVKVDRTVQGKTHIGTVVQSGRTTKNGQEGAYQTFCLTIHDGQKEVPLTGVEIQRQSNDLNLCIGDRVKIVDMGRQTFDMPAGKQGWRNLYQVSLLERARARA